MTVEILIGDALEQLRTLPADHFHCAVTSPPYHGLRDYGVDGMIGLEPTVDEWLGKVIAVMAEVRRVLRPDGLCAVNMGDKWASSPSGRQGDTGQRSGRADNGSWSRLHARSDGYKQGDLISQSHMLFEAMRRDGWYHRQTLVYSKPAPMPSSDRGWAWIEDEDGNQTLRRGSWKCTPAHEYIGLFSRQMQYFADGEAVREPHAKPEYNGNIRAPGVVGDARGMGRAGFAAKREYNTAGRNPRSVRTIGPEGFAGEHYACVDAETECLTSQGWKRHDQLRPGMSAAQFDMCSGRMSWGTVRQIHSYAVEDQTMIVGHRRDLEMWLTPNHRTVVQRRFGHSAKRQPPTVIRADELKPSHVVPTAALWVPEGDESIPAEWAELLGWYVAEGHESKQSLAVEIYQSETANSHKCARIEELLRQTGVEWTSARTHRRWRGRPSVSVAYRVIGYGAVRLRELAPKKRLSWACLHWSADRIEALMRGLIEGDGHVRQDGRACFVQADKQMADLVQALAIRLGHSAMVRSKANAAGMWTVWLTKHKTRSFRGTAGQGAPLERRPYTGTVWCPEVPAGAWMARRNGKIFITGNSFPTELPRWIIRAACSAKGCCSVCGAQVARVVRQRFVPQPDVSQERGVRLAGQLDESRRDAGTQRGTTSNTTIGWRETCDCGAERAPCRVLDCFAGTGTTALAAEQMGHEATLIELNPRYAEMARDRLASERARRMIGDRGSRIEDGRQDDLFGPAA